MPGQAAAFMSYVRFDDDHDDSQLTQFRERLSAEVRVQTGEELLIFQDRNDIAWGESWQRRIDEALDAVTLLIVVITPSFFRSAACRAEVQRFLDRERELGRDDLVLPVYYVSAAEMEKPEQREADAVAKVLASRQLVDWRELRFEPFTSPVARKALALLASRMKDTFWRAPAGTPSPRVVPPGAAASQPGGAEPPSTRKATARTEPPTHVVDQYLRGDFETIGTAVKAALPGDRILVRPGLYNEGIVVDKPLEILGDGPVADIEVRARGADALVFNATIGRVANITLRQVGGEGQWFGVEITQGRLDLEGCDVSSQSLSCVAIRYGADPRLRRNRIHDGKSAGVHVYDGGLGTLEDNDISANALAGVEIRTGGDPTLRRNRIHDGKQVGVLVCDGGLGTLEDNDICGNALAGVEIRTGGDPALRRNRIHDGKSAGVHVHDGGLGTLEDNDISANTSSGVAIRTGGNPTLRGNRIHRNEYQAVRVHEGGRGVLEDNDLAGNKRGAWDIAEDCKDNVTRARNRE
jgi:F-box protein 11